MTDHVSPDDTLANKMFDPILESKRASNLFIIILVLLAGAALLGIGLLATRPVSPEALLRLSQSALTSLPTPFSQ